MDFPPGGFTPAHRHPGAVTAIVLSGQVRSQMQSLPAQTYGPGETWFEPSRELHLFAENPSASEPARLLAGDQSSEEELRAAGDSRTRCPEHTLMLREDTRMTRSPSTLLNSMPPWRASACRRSSSPTLGNLDRLIVAALHRLPFENLDVLLDKPVRIEPDAVFEKVVERHRGGYCFELNSLFARLLSSLDYRVTLLGSEGAGGLRRMRR